MDSATFQNLLEETPVIAAIKSAEDLEKCMVYEGKIVFVLYGDLISIPGIVSRLREAGKTVLVHIDLIDGLAAREVAVDFLLHTHADGVVSTRPPLLRRAKASGLLAVKRFFIFDSLSLHNVERQLPLYVDAVEILPGIMPRVIRRLADRIGVPLIAGGLIEDKEDVIHALKAGAVSVSSSDDSVWSL